MKKLNNKGFNMVEIMVAIAVLLILTVPLINYFIASFKTNASAKRRQYATNLAQETVEEIQGINLEDVLQYYVFDASQNKYTRDDSKEIPQKYKEFTQTYQYIRRTAGNETTGYCYTLFPEKIDKKGKYEFQRSITAAPLAQTKVMALRRFVFSLPSSSLLLGKTTLSSGISKF